MNKDKITNGFAARATSRRWVRAIVSLPLALSLTVGAAAATAQTTASAPEADLVSGVVRKIDKDAGKMTLRHEAIPKLDMPEMTMVYRVKDTAMLDAVKVGETVRFTADKINGQFTVTRIEPSR